MAQSETVDILEEKASQAKRELKKQSLKAEAGLLSAGDDLQSVISNLKGAFDKSLKEQPAMTMAMVAAAGFVVGAIWKR